MTWWEILFVVLGGWLLLGYLIVGGFTVRALRVSILCRDLTWREWFTAVFAWPHLMRQLLRFERQVAERLHVR